MLLPSIALALGSLSATPAPPPQLAVKAIRFFAPDSARTTVLAFVQVPYVLAEPNPAGDRLAWETTLDVYDAESKKVYSESWWNGAPASYRIPEAYEMESLRLGQMTSASLRIVVSVRDSVSGRTATTEANVASFEGQPAVSDLLVASSMRIVAPNDTSTNPGEFARGNVRFVTAPHLTLDALTPTLAFLMEAYTAVEASATTQLEIKNPDGTVVTKLQPFDQTIPAGGGVIRAEFPLDGLPEGNYILAANVSLGAKSQERTAEFAVGSLEAAMKRAMIAKNSAKGIDEKYFASLDEDQLDDAAEALELLAPVDELKVYKADGDGALTVNAKRQFLIQFWATRDSDKGTAINEDRMAFYDLIDRANDLFGESGRNARPGWKTDRGEVFVKYGPPGERNPFPSQERAPAFEIWRYTKDRVRYYIFADRTNFGNFSLVKTNDRNETSAPNWCEIITPETVRRVIEPFLGQRFVETADNGAENSQGVNVLSCN